MTRRVIALAAVVVGFLTACTSARGPAARGPATTAPARTSTSVGASKASTSAATSAAPAQGQGHVVVVVMENHSYSDVIGYAGAPYLNALARQGADLTQMYAITHPSQPNYVALLSGSTHGVTDDVCPQTLDGQTLAQQALAAGLGFSGYSEGLPNIGNETCSEGAYARKHAPWTDFASVPGTASQPFTAFPTDYSRLPAVSFVIPNLDHDMHDGTVSEGDTWLRANLAGYAIWAASHDSQLVITWDEDDRSADNHIPTIIVGAGIVPTTVTTRLTLYSLLRYLEDRFGLPHLGAAATAARIPLPT